MFLIVVLYVDSSGLNSAEDKMNVHCFMEILNCLIVTHTNTNTHGTTFTGKHKDYAGNYLHNEMHLFQCAEGRLSVH